MTMHTLFCTLFCTFFHVLGLEFMLHDISRLNRIGIEPLAILELFLSCEVINTLYALLLVTLFYTVRARLSRSKAARKVLQAAIERARRAESNNLRCSIRLLDDTWRSSWDNLHKALIESNFTRDCAQRVVAGLRDTNDKLHTRNTELDHDNKILNDKLIESQAANDGWERKAKQSEENARAREVVHKAERAGGALQAETDHAKLAKLRNKLRASDSEKRRWKEVARAAEQSASKAQADKDACVADSAEKGRIAAAENASLVSRAERAEEGERIAKQAAKQDRLRSAELEEQVKAGNEREEVSQSHITKLETDLQRSDARVEGLKIDIAGLDLTITGLRVEVTSLEGTVGQLSQEATELRVGIADMETSCGELVTSCEAKFSEWVQAYNEMARDNDALRALLEGRQSVGSANTPPEPTSSSPTSLAESHNDFDTPSLTFCDSGAAIDGSPNQNGMRPTPAQSAVHCTLTTSASVELVTSKSGAALTIVTSSSALSVTYEEPSPRTFASHFVPTCHSTPKRSRPSRRPRHTSSGFLKKVKFCTMELPLRPAVPLKTSTLRPCDVPDFFSPSYRGIDARPQTDASARFVEYLRARSRMLDAQRPNIPHPAHHSGSHGRILYNRHFKFSQTPSGRL